MVLGNREVRRNSRPEHFRFVSPRGPHQRTYRGSRLAIGPMRFWKPRLRILFRTVSQLFRSVFVRLSDVRGIKRSRTNFKSTLIKGEYEKQHSKYQPRNRTPLSGA
jgi:hypothetical protein